MNKIDGKDIDDIFLYGEHLLRFYESRNFFIKMKTFAPTKELLCYSTLIAVGISTHPFPFKAEMF